jgi:NAD-dependent deacetylase
MNLESTVALVKEASSVVVFTGAGVSAESGIPTYRSGGSRWTAEEFETYANPRGYRAHLPDSYEWYRSRAIAVAEAKPNAGHLAIAGLASRVPSLVVVTQNVDGLHLRAGSTDVIELHGNLRETRCDACDTRLPWRDAPADPACPSCDGMLRPDVVMFEEMLREVDLRRARAVAEGTDLLISVGTSNVVWPARELPLLAHDSGAWVVIVNTDLSGQPRGDRVVHVEGRGGTILPALLAAL